MESNLKVLIAKKNITIERLSKEINVSKVTLYRLANGKLKKPKYETLKKVSDFFSISVEELLKKETIWIQKKPFEGTSYQLKHFERYKRSI